MAKFRGRAGVLDTLCTPKTLQHPLMILGEAGIGKSRLLQAGSERLKAEHSDVLVIRLDLSDLPPEEGRLAALIAALVEAIVPLPFDLPDDPELAAAQITRYLNAQAASRPVYLMLDTTEAVQEDVAFWRWLERHVLGPLVAEGRVKVVLAGRIPAPIRLYPVRVALQQLRLAPLAPEPSADLISEVLREHNPALEDAALPEAVSLVSEFACGHPMLAERVAAYVASHWPPQPSSTQLRLATCDAVIQPFVQSAMLEGLPAPWDALMPWITVLRWYDIEVLKGYLERVAPAEGEGERSERSEYFYKEGIRQLRMRRRVVWQSGAGYQVIGVLRDVVLHCMQVREPDRYRRACEAAKATIEALAAGAPGAADAPAAAGTSSDFYRRELAYYEACLETL